MFFVAFILAVFGPLIVKLWVGVDVFAYFVNATNQLGVKLFTSVVADIINMLLSIFMVNSLDLGLEGMILSTIVSLPFFSLLDPMQVYNIISEKKYE